MHIQYPPTFLRYRWTAFILLVAAYMLVFFHRMAPAVVSDELMRSFSTTGAALGSLAAMYYYIYTAMQIPSGILSDTLGPRISASVGMLVAGLGTWLFAQADTIAAASVGRFLVGLGVSVIFVGLMKSNSVWFQHKYAGLLSGVTVFLGNCGSMLAAGPMALLLQEVQWQTAFTGIAIASVVLAVLIFAFVRNSPKTVGLPSIETLEGLPVAKAPHLPWYTLLGKTFSNKKLWPGFWVHFGITGTVFAFAGLWSLPLMRDVHGLDRTAASSYTTIMLLGLALGPIVAGWISDKIHRRKAVVITSILFSILSWLWFISGHWQAGASGLALYFIVGFSSGGVVVLYPHAKEVANPAATGMAISLVNTGLFLGAALAQPVFGLMADWRWSGEIANGLRIYEFSNYQDGLWFCVAMNIIGLLFSFLLTETYCKPLEKKSH